MGSRRRVVAIMTTAVVITTATMQIKDMATRTREIIMCQLQVSIWIGIRGCRNMGHMMAMLSIHMTIMRSLRDTVPSNHQLTCQGRRAISHIWSLMVASRKTLNTHRMSKLMTSSTRVARSRSSNMSGRIGKMRTKLLLRDRWSTWQSPRAMGLHPTGKRIRRARSQQSFK